MPELVPVLAGALRGLLTWLGLGRIFGSIGALSDALQQLGKTVEWLSEVVGDVFAAAKGAEDVTQATATGAGEAIHDIGQDLYQVTGHTYQVVIPHSLARLAGELVSGPIDQLRLRVASVERTDDFLEGWRGQVDSWRHSWVDPNVADWRGFHGWFDGWPRSILYQWHDWFQHPARFADWAAPPLTGAIVSYLARKDHALSRDSLALLLVRAWSDEPGLIWDAVTEWLVT